MDKRALIGIALSILVLVVYQELVTRFYGPPPSAPIRAKTETSQPEKTGAGGAKRRRAVSRTAAVLPRQRFRQPNRPKKLRSKPKTTSRVFTTQGARLKSFKFKKYRSSVDEHSPPFEIVRSGAGRAAYRWVFAGRRRRHSKTARLLYSVQGGDLKLSGDGKGTLGFSRTKRQRRGHHQIFHFLRLVLSDSVRSFGESRGRHGAGPGNFTHR